MLPLQLVQTLLSQWEWYQSSMPDPMKAVKRIFRYLKGTVDLALINEKKMRIFRCRLGRRSGWPSLFNRKSVHMSGSPVSWLNKKQSLSSLEPEYVAFIIATQEAFWLR